MMWIDTLVSKLLSIQYPIIQAPMAGNSPPVLVAAVSNADGLGSLGSPLMTSDQIGQAIKEIRQHTDKPFAVNAFIFHPQPTELNEIHKAYHCLDKYRNELGIVEPIPESLPPYVHYEDQIEVVLEERVPVFSFTLGLLPAKWVKALKARKITIIGTATTVQEAEALETAGADAIVCQGFEAGGHRGSFLHHEMASLVGLMALVPQVVNAVSIPVIASGGIMNGQGIAAALCLGAAGVQMGTAFLTTPEAGISSCYREVLLEAVDNMTTLTRSFTGKHARGFRNRFIVEMADEQIAPFPYQRSLTSKIREVAEQNGRTDLMSLWAGQAVGLARAFSADELIKQLVKETNEVFARIQG